MTLRTLQSSAYVILFLSMVCGGMIGAILYNSPLATIRGCIVGFVIARFALLFIDYQVQAREWDAMRRRLNAEEER